MAAADFQTAKSLTTPNFSIAYAIKNRYYDELFLRTAEKNLVHQQLGQLNRQVPKGENGALIYWTKWINLALITSGAGEGVATVPVAMSAQSVTGTSTQYDAAVSLSDLAVLYSFGDVMKAAMQRLAYNAGLSIDTIVRNVVVPGATTQLAATSSVLTTTAIPATAVLSISEIRKGIRTLENADAFKVGGGVNANEDSASGYWVAVVSPDQGYDIMGDTATGAWIDANRYAGSDKIFEGEIGKLYGVRFLQTSNAYKLLNSGCIASASASIDINVALLTGSDFFGVTTLQNLQTYIKDFGSGGISDPTNKIATAGWKCTFGATILNSAFAVGIRTAASS